MCCFSFSGDSVALNPVTVPFSDFGFVYDLTGPSSGGWMSGGIWMLLWMLKWLHGDGTGILSFQFSCSHICLSLQICFEHSAIDVGVHIASKYLHHLPSALATAVASFQLKIYLQNGQTAWFKSMQDQNHLYLSGPIHSWAHSCIYHNIYSLIQVYSWKARRYQVCAANSWV